MKRERIFIQSNDLSQFHYGGIKKYQKFNVFLIYATLFVLSYLTLNFLASNISGAIALKENYVPYLANFLFQIIHTSFASYFLTLAFTRFYQDHKSFKLYLLWMFIYYGSGVISYGLWFYIQPQVDFTNAKPIDLVFFKYIIYFFLYAILLELVYVIFFLVFDRKVDSINVVNYKIKFVTLFIFFVYTLLFIGYLGGHYERAINFFKDQLIPFFRFRELTLRQGIRSFIILFVSVVPWLFLIALHLNVQRYAKRNVVLKLFSARLTTAFLLANFLFFIVNNSSAIRNFQFSSLNYIYLVITLITLAIFFFLLIWNQIHFNSSIYYFLIVGFFWFLLSWFLVVLYITGDTVNFFSRVNLIILAVALIVIISTIFFNSYTLKQPVLMISNILLQLTGLMFIVIYLINTNLPDIDLKGYDPFLILYVLIALLSLININILLIVFIISLKRLAKNKRNRLKIFSPQTFDKYNLTGWLKFQNFNKHPVNSK
ncbi:hypothetical protein J2Z62_000523 [Mycoplasmoides fastidiosum]|uniref:Transmembrane protein n=1 Tax=Mycoplasmoides fastidiosum TaxID=92758 RepID=A0ABU0LZE8_9BACT|nr:hypothetical protein [Mycoplasmoides fastidiosum]MDQ0514085.1 hypothetical protein [Mycoplasmoides fastidiosum]UUD37505.1 hypothetical protein NPA10_02965 [Mycoplasmoides fastidiosum]